MGLFNRRQSNIDTVPQEVRDYYQSEQRERSGMAWLLAIGTLVMTLILAAGIFVGGRWAYRKIVSTDDKSKVSTAQQEQNSSDSSSTNDNAQNKTDGAKGAPQGTSSTSTSTPSSTPKTSTPAPTSSTASTPAPSTTPTKTTPAATPAPGQGSGTTQPATTRLTNTGPGDYVAPFVAVTVFGAIMHNRLTTRRRTSL